MVGRDESPQGGSSREVEFSVSGMKCAGCEEALASALKAEEAVESVEARAAEGKVFVTLRREVPYSELRRRIEAAGFRVERES